MCDRRYDKRQLPRTQPAAARTDLGLTRELTLDNGRTLKLSQGDHLQLGNRIDRDGINFCVHAHPQVKVQLVVYEKAEDEHPLAVLEPAITGTRRHLKVHDLPVGCAYQLIVTHPDGEQFVVPDPYAQVTLNHERWTGLPIHPHQLEHAPRSLVLEDRYDWGNDDALRPRFPRNEAIIYEMHVGGFTRTRDAQGNVLGGTFADAIKRLDYLQQLGINTIELMPIAPFAEKRVAGDGRELPNYWGYDPLNYFGVHPGYCQSEDVTRHQDEFRDFVREAHKRGMKVILDVVYNHTGEGSLEDGFVHSLRALDPEYYFPEGVDATGCGNTLNPNHPATMDMIVDSLVHHVRNNHVDGFRFDLATVLVLGEDGRPLEQPEIIHRIQEHPELKDVILIAEPWDAAGNYMVGNFPCERTRWADWNGLFRDTARAAFNWGAATAGELAHMLGGSEGIFGHGSPSCNINFITAHDGFTLDDLVHCSEKHNLANGHGNTDGSNDNISRAWGDPTRADRAAKSMIAFMMLSRGVPMVLMGDELRRSQGGNNNAYNQNNETSWMNWASLEQNKDMLQFFQEIIRFRKEHPILSRNEFYEYVDWRSPTRQTPNWNTDRQLAFALGDGSLPEAYVMINADVNNGVNFNLPQLPQGYRWHRRMDTALPAGEDISPEAHVPITTEGYGVAPGAIVILQPVPST